MSDPFGLASAGQELRQKAGELQQRATEIQASVSAATARQYTADVSNGEVRVTVDGRPRVTEVYVDPRLIRSPSLGALVTEALNAAMTQAREGTRDAMLDGLDESTRALVAGALQAVPAPARPTSAPAPAAPVSTPAPASYDAPVEAGAPAAQPDTGRGRGGRGFKGSR